MIPWPALIMLEYSNIYNIHIWYEQKTHTKLWIRSFQLAVQLGSLRIPSQKFLETLPAKPVTTSCKNRFFRRQRTYYAMEVFIRLDNKLLVMTRRNRTAIRYFRHCWNRDNLVPRVFLFSNMAAAPERCINAYARQGGANGNYLSN